LIAFKIAGFFYVLCLILADVTSLDDIRIRFQGGVELVLAPPNQLPERVFPELYSSVTAASSSGELLSVLRDVASSGEKLKSSLSPFRPLGVPVPSSSAAVVPSPVKVEPGPSRAVQYVARIFGGGEASPPSKRPRKFVFARLCLLFLVFVKKTC
jgi:hypothetical protein